MGHQFTFYLLPSDLDLVRNALAKVGPHRILHSRSSSGEPRVVDTLDFAENGQPWYYLYLVREEDLFDVVLRHVPAQGYWTIDQMFSPVVEFSRGFRDGEVLKSGRMYYSDGYYGNDDSWVEKPAAFQTWAKMTFTRTKKVLVRRGANYLGPEAEKWLGSTNGKLEP